MDVRNAVVIVTGATNGIGRTLALDLAQRGASVIGCGRSRARIDETGAALRQVGASSSMIACDVGRRDEAQSLIAKVRADFGRIDVLINNAGVGMREPFHRASLETVEAMTQTNYLGMIYCTHAALPAMIARRKGHIVNISSVAGKIGMLHMAAYCASKFAMNGFSESLYYELKPFGIHVSVICPGPVRTDFARSFAHAQPKAPARWIIGPEKVSRAVIRVIEKPRYEIVMPRSMALACWFQRMAPGLFRHAVQRAFRRYASAPRE